MSKYATTGKLRTVKKFGIPEILKHHKTKWNLEYKTGELKVDILCNCEIEGIK